MPHAYSRLQFEPWLPEFMSRYPKIRLELLLTSLPLNLVEYGVDVAIRAGTTTIRATSNARCFAGYAVVAAPDYLARVEAAAFAARPQRASDRDRCQHARPLARAARRPCQLFLRE